MALEAELTLTLKVLETMADRSQGGILDQPLHTLRHIHSELQACVSAWGTWVFSVESGHRGHHPSAPGPTSYTTLLCPQVKAQSTVGPHPQGRLHHWLHRLHEASKKVSDSRGGWMPGPRVREEADTWEMTNMSPFLRSHKAVSRPLSCSTSSASSKRTWNVSPVETCVSEDLDPSPAHLGPQTLSDTLSPSPALSYFLSPLIYEAGVLTQKKCLFFYFYTICTSKQEGIGTFCDK